MNLHLNNVKDHVAYCVNNDDLLKLSWILDPGASHYVIYKKMMETIKLVFRKCSKGSIREKSNWLMNYLSARCSLFLILLST